MNARLDARPQGEHRERGAQRVRRVPEDGVAYQAIHQGNGAGYLRLACLAFFLCLIFILFLLLQVLHHEFMRENDTTVGVAVYASNNIGGRDRAIAFMDMEDR